MWECQKCHERHDDSFEVCWNCGTSKSGEEDPGFRPAEQVDPASLLKPAEETAIAAGSPPPTPMSEANDYEFSRAQKDVIAGLAFSMKFVGVISLLGGGILFFAGFGNFSTLVQGVLALIVGVHGSGGGGLPRDCGLPRE